MSYVLEKNQLDELVYRLDGPLRWATAENREILAKSGVSMNDKILDIGSGTGYLSLPAAKIIGQNGKIYCVDKSHQLTDILMKKFSQQNLKNFTIVNADALELPFFDNYFDAIICSYTLHELSDVAQQAIDEWFRVLKPNKKLVIADYRKIEDQSRLMEIEAWYQRQPDGGGINERHLKFSLSDIEKFLNNAGFEYVQLETWNQFHMHVIATK